MPDATKKQDNFYVLQKKNILVHTLAIEKERNIQRKTGWMIKLGGIVFFFFEVWWNFFYELYFMLIFFVLIVMRHFLIETLILSFDGKKD